MTVRPDAILTWPTSCDYPLWRAQLARDRDRIGRVLVAFSPGSHRRDYTAFVRDRLADLDVEFADVPYGREWRDSAVNEMLARSDSEWVWFTEQDLLVRIPDRFWMQMRDEFDRRGVCGWREHGEGDRLHPSCLFARRDLVNRTSRDFAPVPGGDHFSLFSEQLEAMRPPFLLDTIWKFGRYDEGDAEVVHMAGLSFNHQLVTEGAEVTHHPGQFRAYLRDCLSGDVHPAWREDAERFLG